VGLLDQGALLGCGGDCDASSAAELEQSFVAELAEACSLTTFTASDSELKRLADAGASVAHCASSNAFLGSGLFPMRRHLAHGVRIVLGTDIGAGTSFSMFNEGLSAYEGQRRQTDGQPLGPVELLYLATRLGAQALGLDDEVGDLRPGKSADLIAIRPPKHSTLEAVLRTEPTPQSQLGAIFTLARETSVEQVRVAGKAVFNRDPG
jgi:guanine deaminase